MHANIDELLEIRDGEPNSKSGHVSECEQCQASLLELKSLGQFVGSQMFDKANQLPSDDVWNRIQRSLESSSAITGPATVAPTDGSNNVHTLHSAPQQSLIKAIYSLAASIAFVGVIAVFMFNQQQNNQIQTQQLQASLNELMLNSRGLEQVLQNVANQNQALSVANQQAADRLYWRLTYVDQLIDQANPNNTERMEVLWNDRIEALNQLNQIYYQRDSTLTTPEI